MGLAAWFVNVVLVYRSRYLKTNYVLGWYWFLLLLATHPEGIKLHHAWVSMLFAIWLAMAYELGDERKNGLVSRSNLGLFSAFLGIFSVAWWSSIAPAWLALRSGNPRQPARTYLQIGAAWAIGFALMALVWTMQGQTLGTELAPLWSSPSAWHMPGAGSIVLLLWLALALGETLRAMTSAKKAKRRGLLLSWIGIFWAVGLYAWQGPETNASAILSVFAAPHMVNLQSYMKRAWMIRLLDISLLAAAFSAVL
ncbi:MAG TPA: hypothetical protein DCG68_04475 [Cryomorphaceae bacterium]|nr:hypothetical protein [Cryomorphaceae bacterium]